MIRRPLSSCLALASLAACQWPPSASESARLPIPSVANGAPSAKSAPTPKEEPAPDPPRNLPPAQSRLLQDWYAAVGEHRPAEAFGELVARSARVQLGRPYVDRPQTGAPEALDVNLETFQCVSFVENTLAVARCTWRNKRSDDCFMTELERLRYRGGKLDGYASRLHYFHDWLTDNGNRNLLQPMAQELGAEPTLRAIDYMTRHPARFPALRDSTVRAAIASAEARLSETPAFVVGKRALRDAQSQLRDGDLVAIVGTKPGLLVTHAGFIQRGPDGSPRLLHASSHHGGVLLTAYDIATYIERRPERTGIIAARPLDPGE